MKFLCDRCQTRYSIGDDRVRGKILKIRCKHCSNVITVREGMTAPTEGSVAQAMPEPGAPGAPGRPKKSTTMAPEVVDERAASGLLRIGSPGKDGPSTVPLRPTRPADEAGKLPARVPAPGLPSVTRPVAGFGGGLTPRTQTGAPATRDLTKPAVADPGRPAGGAPQNVVAAVAGKPPAALEEEWYVSIDGHQSGPYSLADAQRWVASKPIDAELHCWSEGFDDWLPVDKVSHFRGLRKRPVPPPVSVAPPARAAMPARPAPAASLEDTPKPLFAATMASLERGAPPAASTGLDLPPPRGGAGFGPAVAPRTNGAALAAAIPAARPAAIPAAIPEAPEADDGFELDGLDSKTQLQSEPIRLDEPASRPSPLPRAGASDAAPSRSPQPAFAASAAPAAFAAAAAPPAFDPRASASAGPAPGAVDVSPSSTLPGTGANPALTAAAVAGASQGADFRDPADGDDLDIGEVSRVVNLADLARTPRVTAQPANRRAASMTGSATRLTGANPSLRATGAHAALRATGGHPSLRNTGAVPIVPGPGDAAAFGALAPAADFGAPGGPGGFIPGVGMPAEAPPPPAARSHRGLFALLGVAGVVVIGIAVALVVFVKPGDDEPATGGTLGKVHDIDTSRPDDPVTHRPGDLPPGVGKPTGTTGTGGVAGTNPSHLQPQPQPHHPTPPVGSNHDPEPPPAGDALRSDEIEDIARKHQDMTTRCYMRSQRGADAILVGDVKKIAVTLAIEKDGSVSDVQLSDHAADTLGKCLSTSIRSWKFRSSAGGRFRFSLNFLTG